MQEYYDRVYHILTGLNVASCCRRHAVLALSMSAMSLTVFLIDALIAGLAEGVQSSCSIASASLAESNASS
jgi:hypothetical protein